MQDYKTPRLSKRRPLFRGRLPFLKRRQRRALPKGFRPLAALRKAEPRVEVRDLPRPSLDGFRRRPVLRWMYVAVAAWVLVGVGVRGWDLWQASLDKVRVSGLATLTSAQVVQMAGLTAGMRLSDLDPYQVSLRLRQDPRVESADARRVYPHAVWIDVQERLPDIRVALGDGRAAIVDRHDVVIRTEPLQGGDLPLIRGIRATAQPGSVLVAPGLTRARIFLTQAREAGLTGFERASLDVTDPDAVVVSLGRTPRIMFPVAGAAGALRLYGELAGPASGGPIADAFAAAGLADFRFSEGPDGGRIYLRP